MDRCASQERIDFNRNGPRYRIFGHQIYNQIDSSIDTEDRNNSNNNNNNNNDNNSSSKIPFLKNLLLNIKKSKNAILLWALKFHLQIYNLRRFLCIKFAQLYPILKGMYKLLVFSTKFAYLLGYTKHVNPVLNLLGISLVKNNQKVLNNDLARIDANTDSTLSNGTVIINNNNFSSLKDFKNYFTSLSIESKSAIFISILISFRAVNLLFRSERNRSSTLSTSVYSIYNYFLPNTNNNNNNNNNVHSKNSVVNFGADPNTEALKKKEMKIAYAKQLQEQQSNLQNGRSRVTSESGSTFEIGNGSNYNSNSSKSEYLKLNKDSIIDDDMKRSGKYEDDKNIVNAAMIKRSQQKKYYDDITSAAAAAPITSARVPLRGSGAGAGGQQQRIEEQGI